MPFRVPNQADVSFIDQSEPDAGDFAALGDRNTGVIGTGGAVTAQGSPALAVDYSGPLTYVINSLPYTKTAGGSVAIVGGEANPRFDLVVANTASNVVVLKGTASQNPSFPSLDTSQYCLLAAVYVRQSVTSITTGDVVDKRVTALSTFKRSFTDSSTVALQLVDAVPNTTQMYSDGSISWGTSLLKRTASLLSTALDLTTTLTMRAADATLQQLLTLKARTTSPATQNVIEVQPAASTTVLASVSGTGVARFDNFKGGTGSPEGVIVGQPGDLYTQTSPPTLWMKITGTGNTGWGSMQTTAAANLSVLPPATVIALDVALGTAVAGYLYCDGTQYSAVDPVYVALYNVIQVRHGGTLGVNFKVPDYRGYSLVGPGGELGLNVGDTFGNLNGQVGLVLRQVPPHLHTVIDPGHVHPMAGFPYLWKPPAERTGLRPFPAQLAPANVPGMPFMDIWPVDFDITGYTGIEETLYAGGNNRNSTTSVDPVNVMGPVAALPFYIKM